ncbi:uncharacterized protein [Arachis hypogaea]|uniref:uncharacterized protein isoform X1 n=1 Tax=Arachis hypogaea TaxID=3818 RepID=UPI00078936FC|nr:uncharacterized protein LOC112743081 isoform X1 [Arachis hypogaea]XP_025648097.1 uncharacterized protein LOC112743081 isoform X1 [Arachis hypogaea]XP_029147722.1 uncharacterized protein LOC112743081 isoform X1 [Arachis hypogaea]
MPKLFNTLTAEGNTIGFDHTICSPRFWIRIWAIFGFFIALGRSTRSFLLANGFDTLDDPLEDFIRYLIGGSILYYPQLSSISSFQLYVEVVGSSMPFLMRQDQ